MKITTYYYLCLVGLDLGRPKGIQSEAFAGARRFYQCSHYVAHPKFQTSSRPFQDTRDIFPDCFRNPTTHELTEKQQMLITEHFKHIVSNSGA